MITPAELIAIPLFSELSDEQLEFVARSVEDIRLTPGEFAAREGDERALFLVVDAKAGLSGDWVHDIDGPNGIETVRASVASSMAASA